MRAAARGAEARTAAAADAAAKTPPDGAARGAEARTAAAADAAAKTPPDGAARAAEAKRAADAPTARAAKACDAGDDGEFDLDAARAQIRAMRARRSRPACAPAGAGP